MRSFLNKILNVTLLIASLSFVMAATAYMTRNYILNFNIPLDCHVVFIGNSQFEMAINDSAISGAKNVAKSAKQYLFMRIDLEQLLKQNQQIDTVFLVISPFSIRNIDADRSYEDLSYIESTTYYAPYLSYNDIKELPISLPFIKEMLFGGCLKYLFNPQQVGAYIWNTRDDMKADKNRYKKEKTFRLNKVQNGDHITQHQLKLIANICKNHHIKLIYLSPPNWDARNQYDIPLFCKQVEELQKQNNADFWDYTDYPFADSCYADMTHLNWKGAILFTEIIKKRLGR